MKFMGLGAKNFTRKSSHNLNIQKKMGITVGGNKYWSQINGKGARANVNTIDAEKKKVENKIGQNEKLIKIFGKKINQPLKR